MAASQVSGAPKSKLQASGGRPLVLPPQPEPIEFQRRAIAKVISHMSQGANVVLVAPTGAGKTVMMGKVAEHVQGAVMAISHTNALREQLERRLCSWSYTIQGVLSGQRPPKSPAVIVYDEAHHSESDEWREVRRLFPKAQWLGATATPSRSDGRPLTLFHEMVVAAHYSELIQDGVIVPCRVSGPASLYTDKRPDPVKAYLQVGENKPVIFFAQDIEGADDIAQQLNRRKIVAVTFHSAMPAGHRKKAFELFESGGAQALCTVDAITEGVDLPNAHVGVLDQECHTIIPYLQATGRILRSAPGKRFAHLIDLRGASHRHGWPTIDRDYSLHGAGIQTPDESRETIERADPERQTYGRYDAKIVTWNDWQWPNAEDRRRQLGWLRRQAAAAGYTEEAAEGVFKQLFAGPGKGYEREAPPPSAPKSSRKKESA